MAKVFVCRSRVGFRCMIWKCTTSQCPPKFFFRVLNSILTTQLTLKVRFSHSASTELLSTGKCNKAMDVALINNGINDSFTPLAWNDSLLWFLNLEERKIVCGHNIIIVLNNLLTLLLRKGAQDKGKNNKKSNCLEPFSEKCTAEEFSWNKPTASKKG